LGSEKNESFLSPRRDSIKINSTEKIQKNQDKTDKKLNLSIDNDPLSPRSKISEGLLP